MDIGFLIGWTAALLVVLGACVVGLGLTFYAGAEWKRRQLIGSNEDTDPNIWKVLLGLGAIVIIGLVISQRYF